MRNVLFIAILFLTLTGCFTEPKYFNDGKPGIARFIIDWNEEEQEGLNNFVGHFYPIADASISTEHIIDTISRDENEVYLSYARYNAFMYSDTSSTFIYRGMDKYNTAQVYLTSKSKPPFSTDNSNIKYILQPAPLYIGKIDEFLINTDESVLERAVQPRLAAVTATLKMSVQGIDNVLKARASLSGVAESMNFSTEKADINQTGSIIFDFDINEDKTGVEATIHYFEIFKSETVKNILNVVFILKNGTTVTGEHIFDITENISDEVRISGGDILLDATEVVMGDLVNDAVDDWEGVQIKHLLEVNSRTFVFDDVVELVDPNLKKDLIINSSASWEIVEKEADWLIISAMTGSEGMTVLKISLDAPTTPTALRNTSFKIKSGDLSQTIEVKHYGKFFPFPNCYIVAPGGSVDVSIRNLNIFWGKGGDGAIAVKMGNGDLVDPDAPAITNNIITDDQYIVEVLWRDIETCALEFIVSGSGFNVSNIPNNEGNIVVGVRKGGSDYLWSWHLWVTNFNPNANSIVLPNGRVAMDRNLGATSNAVNDVNTLGLLYQWGRKDPFVGPKEIVSSTYKTTYGDRKITNAENNTGSLLLSVNNPSVFYTGDKDAFSKGHLTGGKGYNRWGGATTHIDKVPHKNVKSIYDPSPEGWRMPWGEDWSGFAVTSDFEWKINGRLYRYADKSSFFPVTGMRQSYTGTLQSVSSVGVYWNGTSISDVNGYYLELAEDKVEPAGRDRSRANGFAVRPVRE